MKSHFAFVAVLFAAVAVVCVAQLDQCTKESTYLSLDLSNCTVYAVRSRSNSLYPFSDSSDALLGHASRLTIFFIFAFSSFCSQ
jgi:hypothetical protein